MNSSISRTHGRLVSSEEHTKLAGIERLLLLLPTVGGLVFGVLPLWLGGMFGLLPLFIPVLGATLTGFQGTDVFLIRQAGAASLGYAVMSIVGIRSGVWTEIRLPLLMALVFNGGGFIASVVALLSGEPVLMSLVIGAASLFVTVIGPSLIGGRDSCNYLP